jgi:hypothetical protein
MGKIELPCPAFATSLMIDVQPSTCHSCVPQGSTLAKRWAGCRARAAHRLALRDESTGGRVSDGAQPGRVARDTRSSARGKRLCQPRRRKGSCRRQSRARMATSVVSRNAAQVRHRHHTRLRWRSLLLQESSSSRDRRLRHRQALHERVIRSIHPEAPRRLENTTAQPSPSCPSARQVPSPFSLVSSFHTRRPISQREQTGTP